MSNPFRGTSMTYFQFPQPFVTSDIFLRLGVNEWRLYAWLLSEAQRKSSLTVEASGKQLAERLGISEAKVVTARGELKYYKLISPQKFAGGYRYVLTNPANGLPIVNPEKKAFTIDFDSLSEEQLRLYFGYHLKHRQMRDTDNGLEACCPFHDDQRPSLSVNLGSCTWQCHGCKRRGKLIHFQTELAKLKGEDINASEAHKRILRTLSTLGVGEAAIGQPEAIYAYSDWTGEVVFEVVRYVGKDFSMRRPHPEVPGQYINRVKDAPKLLYRLGEVTDADTVVITEGEKDADTIRGLGLMSASASPIAATTNAGGAGKWTKEHAEELKGKYVLLCGDNDERGREHMRRVRQTLEGIATEIAVVPIPMGFNDVSEYLEVHSVQEFVELIPEEWLDDPAVGAGG